MVSGTGTTDPLLRTLVWLLLAKMGNWIAGTTGFAIGFVHGARARTGYLRIGGDFAFVIDEERLERAFEADRREAKM